MPDTLLFALVFVCQIWLISYYYPTKLSDRLSYLIKHYPPETHPKLYPESVDTLLLIKRWYLVANYLMIAVGTSLLFYFTVIETSYAQHQDYLEDLPLQYGIIQFIPLFLLELLGRRQLKLMRSLDTRSARTAELTPRKLSDFVSPWFIAAAVLALFGCIAFELWFVAGSPNENFWIKLASLIFANAIFAAVILWKIHGKKVDPYQAKQDRQKYAKFTITSSLSISIFVSFFIVAQTLVNNYELHYIEILINSLYFQVLAVFGLGAVINGLKVDELDLSVYQ